MFLWTSNDVKGSSQGNASGLKLAIVLELF